MHIVQQRQSACFLPAPRCPRSWHHQWQGHLGSSHLVPPQSKKKKTDLRGLYFYVHVTTNKDTVHCFQQVLWNILDILHMLVQYQRLENSSQNSRRRKRTIKFPVLLEQAKRRGGWASILSLSLVEVRYSVFPPRASQNWSVKRQKHFKLLQPSEFVRGQSNSLTFG